MTNQVEATAVAPKKQYAGRPFIISKRRKENITQHPKYNEAREELNGLIQKYGAKYCQVRANNKGVNIKFKILKRLYFFALAEDFPASVKKLGDLVFSSPRIALESV
ncbi:MAG: hypothetical protein Q4A00_04025 [Flavobacteriaceae bacterium]|nr:hypothetical protein [Flavobacteriaceae bacterium]